MPTHFNVAITKEIIKECKNCGIELHAAERNCAIAVALRDIFPNVYVSNFSIYPFGIDFKTDKEIKIPLPLVARQFIKLFDGFSHLPQLRLLLPEFDFMLEIPDDIIEEIDIEEVKELIYAGRKNNDKSHKPSSPLFVEP